MSELLLKDKHLWHEYLSNMQVNVLVADYTHCPRTWREIDYIPNYNKFYFVQSGEGWLKIGENEYYPSTNQLYIMPEGVVQSYSVVNPGNTLTKYWCHFTATVGGMPFFQLIEYPHYVEVDNPELLCHKFDRLIECMECEAITDSLEAKILMYQIILDFITMGEESVDILPTSTPAIRLMPVLEYIEENIDREIFVSDLADIAHLSPSYFTRYFQNVMGIPPKDYITQKKLERAKTLLDMTDYTILEIANKVGYKDPFHFSNIFKKYMGMAPIEYQKRRR